MSQHASEFAQGVLFVQPASGFTLDDVEEVTENLGYPTRKRLPMSNIVSIEVPEGTEAEVCALLRSERRIDNVKRVRTRSVR